MTDFDFSEYFYDDGGGLAAGGDDVQFEFVKNPALEGDYVEFSFRTLNARTAPAGTVVAQIIVATRDRHLLGGGRVTIQDDLGPNDTREALIFPLLYTPGDGDYSLAISVGRDVRDVAYRVRNHGIQAT